jgi:aminoglycoside phosphotransferase (APT) family kinase protein
VPSPADPAPIASAIPAPLASPGVAPPAEPTTADVPGIVAPYGITEPTTPILGGWASWTFDLGGRFILRIARNPQVAAAHLRESRLLPELARHVSFGVPEPLHLGDWRGHTYMIYPRLPGRALLPTDDLAGLAPMLQELHSFPVARAISLLGCAGTPQDWQAQYEQSWQWVSATVEPRLPGAELRRAYRRFLRTAAGFTPALIHRDLGTEHVLTLDGRPTAIIDFEDATVGDPAIDFAGFLSALGAPATRQILSAYLHPIDPDRVRFYWWMGSAHAVHYGTETGDTTLATEATTELARRLSLAESQSGQPL